MYRVAFATGSRADYGIVRKYLSMLNQDREIKLDILVTGALLEEKYGHMVDLIYQDGFHIGCEIKSELSATLDRNILHSMSVTLDRFGSYFEKNSYDLLIILGDRYEMLSVAVAAAMQKMLILHIHGGEATFANYDEFIRHSITKMSRYHFTATKEYEKRVIQLGEDPKRVYYMGALGAENAAEIQEENVSPLIKKLPEKKYMVVLFHPETISDIDVTEQTNIVLKVIEDYPQFQYIFLGNNADTDSDKIRECVHEFVNHHENASYFENLSSDTYHYLLKRAICLIGNSSSGIIEAPSLKIMTINIGNRQKGRVQGNSILNVTCDYKEIKEAIKKVISQYLKIEICNPYFKENTAKEYYNNTKQILKNIEEDKKELKIFYDLNF